MSNYTMVSMTPSGVPPVIYMSQYDVGRYIGFVCDADMDSYTVMLEATRSDGVAIIAHVGTDGNYCAFLCTATMTNVAGEYFGQIVVTDDDSNRIASIPIRFIVVKAAMDENSETIEEDASLFQQYTGTVQALIADIRSDYAGIADTISGEAVARESADTALETALAQEVTARTNAVAAEAATRLAADTSLQSQIDSLSTLSEGSTTGDAELINGRTAYDGITYSNIGTAIRTQVSHLHGITNYSGLVKRHYFTHKFNGVVMNTSGVMTSSSGSFCTEFIPVNGIVILSIGAAYSITGGYNICWYDEDRAFLSGQAFATLGAAADYEVLYPPSTAKYIVISNQNSGYSASDFVESPVDLDTLIDAQMVRTYLMSYEEGYYLSTSGANTANASWFVTDPIPVHGIYHIYMVDATALKTNGVNVAFYAQSLTPPFNLTFVSGYSLVDGANDAWGVVPDGATHMVICQPISKRNAVNYVDSLPHPWSKLRLNSAGAIYNFLKNPVPYTEIDIVPGTYDLYAAGFASDIAADEIYYPYMRDVIIHGNGATLKCNCPADVAEAHGTGANACSIINEMGNVEISDLTLDASNIRYAIHSECQAAKVAYGTRHIYRNVKAINATTASSITTNGNAVGMGASRGQYYQYDDCTFTSSDSKPAFYTHGRLSSFEGITFRHCVFNGGTAIGALLAQYTGNGVAIPVSFDSCLVGTVQCNKQSGGENYDYQFVITAVNSYIPTLTAGSGVTFISAPRRINAISGTVDTSYSS